MDIFAIFHSEFIFVAFCGWPLALYGYYRSCCFWDYKVTTATAKALPGTMAQINRFLMKMLAQLNSFPLASQIYSILAILILFLKV